MLDIEKEWCWHKIVDEIWEVPGPYRDIDTTKMRTWKMIQSPEQISEKEDLAVANSSINCSKTVPVWVRMFVKEWNKEKLQNPPKKEI